METFTDSIPRRQPSQEPMMYRLPTRRQDNERKPWVDLNSATLHLSSSSAHLNELAFPVNVCKMDDGIFREVRGYFTACWLEYKNYKDVCVKGCEMHSYNNGCLVKIVNDAAKNGIIRNARLESRCNFPLFEEKPRRPFAEIVLNVQCVYSCSDCSKLIVTENSANRVHAEMKLVIATFAELNDLSAVQITEESFNVVFRDKPSRMSKAENTKDLPIATESVNAIPNGKQPSKRKRHSSSPETVNGENHDLPFHHFIVRQSFAAEVQRLLAACKISNLNFSSNGVELENLLENLVPEDEPNSVHTGSNPGSQGLDVVFKENPSL